VRWARSQPGTPPLEPIAAACSTLIAFYFWPLPWTSNEQLVLPPLYILAIWVANLVAIVFTAILIFLMVGGSFWIMFDLHNRMAM